MSFSKTLCLPFYIVLIGFTSISALSVTCPDPDPNSDLGCTCFDTAAQVSCTGSNVTELNLQKYLVQLRSVNGLAADGWLNLTALTIWKTQLTSLSVGILAHLSLQTLYLSNNDQLKEIAGGFGTAGKFEAEIVYAENCVLTRFEIGSMVKTRELYLRRNKFVNFDDFALVSKLELLDLSYNKFTTFYLTTTIIRFGLSTLILSHNQITKITGVGSGPERPDESFLDKKMTIYLDHNQLTDGHVADTHWMAQWNRPVDLHLQGNNFVYLSQAKWETFLYTDFDNSLRLFNNSFICDQRMAWIKEARVILEQRVLNVDCLNDPGHSVFDTDKIH